MLKIALCGNIASGKSLAQKILENHEYKVFDTDVAGHKILEICSDVKNAFSDALVNGKISREKLGKIVFDDPKKLEKLNSIVHPLIEKEIIKFFEQNNKEKIVFVGIPLLFEAGMEKLFDKIIFIYADDKIRFQRLIQRNNYSEMYAKKRMLSQLPQEEKASRSDIIIKNNETIQEFEVKLLQAIRSF